jgi:DNA-binding NtrC family response regulator
MPEAEPVARILIVDDDGAQLETLSALLAEFVVEQARRVGEARMILARQNVKTGFDVVLLDIHLPDGRGTDLLPYIGGAAVILVSGDGSSADFRKHHPAVHRRAVKPYDAEIMVGWVSVLAKMGKLRKGRSWTPLT